MNLNDNIKIVKGVGEKRCEALNRMNIYSIKDLLYLFPRKYEDRRNPSSIISAPLNKDVLLEVVCTKKLLPKNPYLKHSVLRILCEDKTGTIELLFFNAKYLSSYFIVGEKYSLFGRVTINNGRKQMAHPEFHKLGDKDDVRGIFPIYPLTKGITQGNIRLIETNIKPYIDLFTEWLPNNIVKENKLCDLKYALENIHFPKNERSILEAKYRLVFEELLTLQTGLFYIKRGFKDENSGICIPKCDMSKLIDSLPFKLTDGQIEAFNDISNDLADNKAMNRLVQGDVGSGKTIVFELAIYQAKNSGFQSALMVPTEILAKQHYASITRDLGPLGVRAAMITGSSTKKEKEEILNSLTEGEIDLIIGTHALIEPNVIFKNLGLVITDEQHRFGVNQRSKLKSKGKNPNILVMTATPIPRTLAVILYGDLDISQIKSMPKGRLPIKTYSRNYDKRDKIYDFLENQVKNGYQGYIVCPLIDENETLDLKSASELYKELSLKYPSIRFALLHGEIKDKEKNDIMEKFLNHEFDVLVSTVVIEVGIDVPNANTIIIENSERFGLAQLHQLRGRVGRSDIQSYCILLSNSNSDIAKKRHEIMVSSNSGFDIAQEDLNLRGPGEIFGTKQHGIPELSISDLVKNMDILKTVQSISNDILNKDPLLKSDKYHELKLRIQKLFGENIDLEL